MKRGTVLDKLSLRRYDNGSILAERDLGEKCVKEFGAPWMYEKHLHISVSIFDDCRVIHRQDYHSVLLSEAERLGVNILLDQCVVSVAFAEKTVTIQDGTVWKGDIVVGADGEYIRSLLH